ncbi:hypothetical protein QUB80_04110 [Chlorogloeopsis sp. ULAP01]|nr:hypothetical protein [Chlorogloeopsis sp. ULAP01]MDM9379882.1 hypothetical protein [Chlorogloeopsis sp. ULAP01]
MSCENQQTQSFAQSCSQVAIAFKFEICPSPYPAIPIDQVL